MSMSMSFMCMCTILCTNSKRGVKLPMDGAIYMFGEKLLVPPLPL